jgi:hypothetical protein
MDLAGAINGALANNGKDIDRDDEYDRNVPERERRQAPSALPKPIASVCSILGAFCSFADSCCSRPRGTLPRRVNAVCAPTGFVRA